MGFKQIIAFIGGSGLARGLESILVDVRHIENEQDKFGTVPSYYIGMHKDTRVIILPRHGDSVNVPAKSPAELVKQKGYETNIWALHELGAEAVFATSAVGVLDNYTPLASEGSFIVPDAYMRGFAASQHSFGKYALNIHTPMSKPFDEMLRLRAIRTLQSAGYEARDEALYIYNGGDTFETPSEIAVLEKLTRKHALSEFMERNFRKKRDRLVGMTIVPEAILLNQLNIPFAAICSNVNYAEGLSTKTLVSHEQTMDVMSIASKYLLSTISEIIKSYD